MRIKRLTLGFSAEHLSFILKRSHGYVLTVENIELKTQYPPHEWPKLATALNCTVHDLLPDANGNSTGGLVDKMVLNLSIESDLKLVFTELVNYGFFDQDKSLQEIADHLFIRDPEQLELLKTVLNGFVMDGLLKPKGTSIFIVNDQNKKL